MSNTKKFFTVPKFWNKKGAIAYANENGLAHYTDSEGLHIEIKFEPAKFECEGDDNSYTGYRRLMNDWNGWEQPYFTREELELLMRRLFALCGEYTDTRFEGDKFILCRESYPEEPEEVTPEIITVNGEDLTVYACGFGWCWSLQQEQEQDEDEIKFDEVLTKAKEAFWAIVAASYPEAKTGDFPPDADIKFDDATKNAVDVWLSFNHPARQ